MIEKFYCGQVKEYIRKLEEADVIKFADLTGDRNPVHVDKRAAEESIFKGQVAHGMFVASLISCVLGMELPGPGTIYREQAVKFLKPVYIGDTVRVRVEIVSLDKRGNAKLSTNIYNQTGDMVVEGAAFVKLPKERG